jgi:hypothetical protein
MTSPLAISHSAQPTAARSRPWPEWPTIVAESLAPVADPLATVLHAGPWAEPDQVAGALAASLLPPEADACPPEWLWESQRTSFRRVLAALARYRGALLADPVGTGKTFVALAVAGALNGSRSTTCLVPAALREQWQRIAGRAGVSITPWSHERLSRGALPPHVSRLVVIDECHRLRNSGTRRYEHAAAWLSGHTVLMLSATPIVNRLADLAHQLRLAVRDDVLAPHGVASIMALMARNQGHPALGLIVISGIDSVRHRPSAIERVERPGAPEHVRLLGAIDALTLSTDAPIAALLRCLLWRAAASSPAALAAALRRYRRLLLHARDAVEAGQRPNRRALLHLIGDAGDQLMLWGLLPQTDGPVDLALGDLSRIDELIARLGELSEQDDPKLGRVRSLLGDGCPTIVFSVSRDTVGWLRHRLGPRVAWCTGDRAGIGATRLPRRSVFCWFDAGAPDRRLALPDTRLAPAHLVSTDVAAEGLDLQGAARVVHYDLPWTPMRLDQRRGRVVRAGSPHQQVEIVRLDPPPELEQRLRQAELLVLKSGLPAVVGLGERSWWTWRSDTARTFAHADAIRGASACAASPPGILAGFTLHRWPSGRTAPIAVHLMWWDPAQGWSEDPGVIQARLDQSRRAPRSEVSDRDLRAGLRLLAGAVRERIRAVRLVQWETPTLPPAARQLVVRLGRLARDAARRRDAGTLAQVRRAMAVTAGGHTAGEVQLLERLASAPDRDVIGALMRLPDPVAVPAILEARVTGVILFTPGLTFPRWPPSAPFCSTSTARSSTPSA